MTRQDIVCSASFLFSPRGPSAETEEAFRGGEGHAFSLRAKVFFFFPKPTPLPSGRDEEEGKAIEAFPHP